MRFYRDSPSLPNRPVIDEAVLSDSSWHLMDFSHPQLERLFYADIEGDFVAPDTGSFKFGLAVYGSANLYIDDKLVIESTTVQRGGNFFFGKGTLEEKVTVGLVQAREAWCCELWSRSSGNDLSYRRRTGHCTRC
jgi:beta-glucosidase